MPVVKIYTTRGFYATIDEVDRELVTQFRWHAHLARGTWYARCYVPMGHPNKEWAGKHIYMHRMITGAKKGFVVDHDDEDGLNNTRINLTVCGFDDNAAKARYQPSRSGFRGVDRDKNKFRARIAYDGKQVCLGRFDTAEEAAKRYDEEALKIYGFFAWTNFGKERRVPVEQLPEDIPF